MNGEETNKEQVEKGEGERRKRKGRRQSWSGNNQEIKEKTSEFGDYI